MQKNKTPSLNTGDNQQTEVPPRHAHFQLIYVANFAPYLIHTPAGYRCRHNCPEMDHE
jgi:hypothetical protein